MPQLPSGRHVDMCAAIALERAVSGHFGFHLAFKVTDVLGQDLSPIIRVMVFEPTEGFEAPSKPRFAGFMLSELRTKKCDWSKPDIAAFRAHLKEPDTKVWLEAQYEEIRQAIKNTPVIIPEALGGLFD
ncbi:MAG: hypothetical protein HYX63_01735 [Gammaproteobacteria bacterium]|nr:hypothetical protein [Gammaproteobacteria bacterium]